MIRWNGRRVSPACRRPSRPFDPLPFNTDAARAFGRLASAVRRPGRSVQPRAMDVLIASVAVANELPLYTCNPDDFAGMAELELVAVPHPDTR